MKKGKRDLRRAVKAGEENALEVLVDLFDWLDGLEPQPTTEVYRKSRNIRPMIADTYAKHSTVSRSTCTSPGAQILSLLGIGCEPEAPDQPNSETEPHGHGESG